MSAAVTSKEGLRQEVLAMASKVPTTATAPGLIAERLRSLQAYRDARSLFIMPALLLKQIRVNCLADGKRLLMPLPGLKDGFSLLDPEAVAPKDRAQAVTPTGLERFGRRLRPKQLSDYRLDIIVTDGLAVAPGGHLLGDGNGFLDLAYALLRLWGAATEKSTVVAVVAEEQTAPADFPIAAWDVPADAILTSDHVRWLEPRPMKPAQIFWDELPFARIKRITPLWQLSRSS